MSVEPYDGRIRLIQSEIDKALDERGFLRGGGSGRGGGLDAWQTTVESRLASLDSRILRLDEKIDRNFQVTWGGLITTALGLAGLILGLAGLMAKGFGWL